MAVDHAQQEIVVVDECIEGTPAAACGQIESGDILVEVNGNPTAGKSPARAQLLSTKFTCLVLPSNLTPGASFEQITAQFAGKKQVRLKFLRREVLPDI